MRLAALLLLCVAIVPGCHREVEEEITVIVINQPTGLSLNASGGTATGPATGVTGGNAGAPAIHSEGSIRFGVNPPPVAPAAPAPPASFATTLTGTIGSSSTAGHVQVGDATTTTGGPITISSTDGDVVVSGTLTSGDAGTPVALTISAPNGTVFITGVVRTANTDGTADGESAGSLTITASRIVVTGAIDATGESGGAGAGGDGGVLSITSSGSDILFFGGSVNTTGGASPTDAGDGGAVTITSAAEIRLHGTTLTSDGGSASGTADATLGGFAGALTIRGPAGVAIDATLNARGGTASTSGLGAMGRPGGAVAINTAIGSTGPVQIYGAVNAAGGSASAATGTVSAGTGGALLIGNASTGAPSAVDLGTASFTLRGGTSTATGGNGPAPMTVANGYNQPGGIHFNGAIDFSAGFGATTGGASSRVEFVTNRGDIRLSGSFTGRGGDSGGTPGAGGQVRALAGDNEAADFGSIYNAASIDVRGGSSTSTGDAPGGSGVIGATNAVDFIVDSPNGSVFLQSGSSIDASGGNATGTGTAGSGGRVLLSTEDDAVSIAGSVASRGGTGSATAGTGGEGGEVQALTNSDGDGTAGPITLEAGATIDVSGGQGATGGDARSDAAAGVTAPIAVLFDAGGIGTVTQTGSIVARGGDAAGDGGDVRFDGAGTPVAGPQDLSAGLGGTLAGSFEGL